jgi:hypothetical protein
MTMHDELDPQRLQRLLDAAARLPRHADASRDLWPDIRERIAPAHVVPLKPRRAWRAARWIAAAAAVVVIAVFGSTFAPRTKAKAFPPPVGVATPADPGAAPQANPGTPGSRGGTGVAVAGGNAPLSAALAAYDDAARDLEAAVTPRLAQLPPETRAVVERSLDAIDVAIADLRTALGEHPGDAAINRYLAATYEQKLDFLRRVRAIPAAGM